MLLYIVVVQSLSCVWFLETPWSVAHQASLSSPSPGGCSNSCLLSWWCHPTSRPLLSPSPPAFYLPQHQEAKGLELQLQHQSFQWIFRVDFHLDWLVWSPCSPKDSQESSPTPQFESINSSALSLLNGSALTSIHDYWSLAVRKS